jgi:hypothetical protein
MFTEEVKSLPLTKHGRPDPMATSRLEAELHLRFWLPIAQILDPRDNANFAGAAVQDFYSRRGPGLPDLQESLALMKHYLGVPRLTLGTWFRLLPIYRDLLEKALSHADMDLVVCAVREFVRLELGQAPDPLYGLTTRVAPSDVLDDEDWCQEDDAWASDMEAEKGYVHFGSSENNDYLWTQARHQRFHDPAAFEKRFPGMPERRPNMAHALKPIFDRDDMFLIDTAVCCATALLARPFDENRFNSGTASNSVKARSHQREHDLGADDDANL